MKPLPPAALIPGLALAIALDLAAICGYPTAGVLGIVVPVLYGLIPLAVLACWRFPLRSLGLVRHRAILDTGWGLVWGGLWRIGSMGMNYLYNAGGLLLSINLPDSMAVLLLPALEEFFFRGYLGRGLNAWLGRWRGIALQALLFTLLPAHWNQGMPHIAAIFLFGLLAGWLVDRRRSLWPAVGAHVFANLLTRLLVAVAG